MVQSDFFEVSDQLFRIVVDQNLNSLENLIPQMDVNRLYYAGVIDLVTDLSYVLEILQEKGLWRRDSVLQA